MVGAVWRGSQNIMLRAVFFGSAVFLGSALTVVSLGCDDAAIEQTSSDAAVDAAAVDAAPLDDARPGGDARGDADRPPSDSGSEDAGTQDSSMNAEPPTQLALPDTTQAPACGDNPRPVSGLIPDQTLAAKATRVDRVFAAVNGRGHGLNADVRLMDEGGRQAVEIFTIATDLWDLETADLNPDDLVASYEKAAGLYAGVGIAADAYRYMALRDAGAPCQAVDRARSQLRHALEMIHTARRVTGTPGVMPRALARTDLPGGGQTNTVPLFDESGEPLPAEKNNGTWRRDQSGEHPEYIWEDSCSRDMYVGWVVAMGAVWEAIGPDPAFGDALKNDLRALARELLASLREVRQDGYDLEIRDADGRRTYHGILNENSIDRVYLQGAPNGFNALMSAGIVSALAYISGWSDDLEYAQRDLIDGRGLLTKARDTLPLLDGGAYTNVSGYNMAFLSAHLAWRYSQRAIDKALIAEVMEVLYHRDGATRQPVEQSQALYDIVTLMVYQGDPVQRLDLPELALKIKTILSEFPEPPVFAEPVMNCDDAEVERLNCVANDGTPLPLLGAVGWNDDLVAAVPVPMRLRPRSNFYWRSNPYAVNGGGDRLSLLPGADFRFVYWLGRTLPPVSR